MVTVGEGAVAWVSNEHWIRSRETDFSILLQIWPSSVEEPEVEHLSPSNGACETSSTKAKVHGPNY